MAILVDGSEHWRNVLISLLLRGTSASKDAAWSAVAWSATSPYHSVADAGIVLVTGRKNVGMSSQISSYKRG